MKRFNELYLGHQNRFTGLRYKDDPAIVGVADHQRERPHEPLWQCVAAGQGTYPNTRQSTCARRRVSPESTRFQKKRSGVRGRIGPSKLFLNDLEQRFDVDMIANLRGLGVKAPIVTTSTWGSNPLSSLPALTTGNIIDVHSYGGVGELDKNPIIGPNLMHWMAAAQVVGKPLTVTEWGVDSRGSLAPDRQDIPLYIASSASMQGWAAVMFFAYSQEPLSDSGGTPSIYQAYNDPALMASLPAAALLYRQGHVKEAGTTYVFAPSKELLFDHSISPANSVALRTAAERGKLLIAMPRVSGTAVARKEHRSFRRNHDFQSAAIHNSDRCLDHRLRFRRTRAQLGSGDLHHQHAADPGSNGLDRRQNDHPPPGRIGPGVEKLGGRRAKLGWKTNRPIPGNHVVGGRAFGDSDQ